MYYNIAAKNICFFVGRRYAVNQIINLIVEELKKANTSQLREIYKYVKRVLS